MQMVDKSVTSYFSVLGNYLLRRQKERLLE